MLGNPPYDFKDAAVLVTGGNSGIGASVVRAFAAAGARVGFCGLHRPDDMPLEAELRQKNYDHFYRQCDLRRDSDCAAFVEAAMLRFGKLDIAINAAAISLPPARLADVTPAKWRDVMATNVDGVFHAMRHEIAAMMPSRSGVIINIASILGNKAAPWVAAYGASKHAVLGLTRAAAAEYAEDGIRILAVSPGPVDTPMFQRAQQQTAGAAHKYAGGLPPGRIGQPDDIATLVLFLASADAAYINAANIIIDGGLTGTE